MPTLEHVCKRLFTDPNWFVKCMVGALLLVCPIAHFLAFGYLYALLDMARRGEEIKLPEWEDWGRMFINGVAAFIIFLFLGVAPVVVAWGLTWPLRWFAYGAFVYLPLVPAIMLAGPLTAAGIYQYQVREEYRDAFRLRVLGAMLRSTKGHFWVPTLALIGFYVAGYPLMTFTIFVGLAASWTYYASFYSHVRDTRQKALRAAA